MTRELVYSEGYQDPQGRQCDHDRYSRRRVEAVHGEKCSFPALRDARRVKVQTAPQKKGPPPRSGPFLARRSEGASSSKRGSWKNFEELTHFDSSRVEPKSRHSVMSVFLRAPSKFFVSTGESFQVLQDSNLMSPKSRRPLVRNRTQPHLTTSRLSEFGLNLA